MPDGTEQNRTAHRAGHPAWGIYLMEPFDAGWGNLMEPFDVGWGNLMEAFDVGWGRLMGAFDVGWGHLMGQFDGESQIESWLAGGAWRHLPTVMTSYR
jgi:hypothetical protein